MTEMFPEEVKSSDLSIFDERKELINNNNNILRNNDK